MPCTRVETPQTATSLSTSTWCLALRQVSPLQSSACGFSALNSQSISLSRRQVPCASLAELCKHQNNVEDLDQRSDGPCRRFSDWDCAGFDSFNARHYNTRGFHRLRLSRWEVMLLFQRRLRRWHMRHSWHDGCEQRMLLVVLPGTSPSLKYARPLASTLR